jgi:transcriptional regulator with XRE-family HTH domain
MLNIALWNKTRKEQKITLEILAEKSGIALSTLKEIFRGKTTTPRIDTVQAIERALGLAPTFTEEERALGLSENHLIAMSDKDRHRFHVLAFADEQLGEDFVDSQINLLEMAANAKAKK